MQDPVLHIEVKTFVIFLEKLSEESNSLFEIVLKMLQFSCSKHFLETSKKCLLLSSSYDVGLTFWLLHHLTPTLWPKWQMVCATTSW